MDAMAEIRLTFFQECEEQLAALENGLLSMQEGQTDSETVNAVFRAVHSIKGGAGAFKLDALVSFAHVFETALDRVRSGELSPDADGMKLFLRAADALSDLVTASRDGALGDTAPYDAIEEEFEALMGGASARPPRRMTSRGWTSAPSPRPSTRHGGDARPSPPTCFRIRFRPLRDMYAKANDPLALFRELSRLGSVTCQCDHQEPALPRHHRPGGQLSLLGPQARDRERACGGEGGVRLRRRRLRSRDRGRSAAAGRPPLPRRASSTSPRS